jgi:hypothetical protein
LTPKAGSPALTSTVLTPEQMTLMTKIAQQVEIPYCRSKPGYYGGDCRFVFLDPEKPGALDMEFKFLENGHFLLKQNREFAGR